MPKLEHYTIGCHGSLTLTGGDKTDNSNPHHPFTYFELTDPFLAIPDDMTVVAYIPPGTIFSARSGAKIQNLLHKSLRQKKLATEKGTADFITTLRDKLGMKETEDYATNDRLFYNFGYDPSAVSARYPEMKTKDDNHDIYDYSLTGPRDQEQRLTFEREGFDWGIHAFTPSDSTVRQISQFVVGTRMSLSLALSRISKDRQGDNQQYVHLIFCRVEILDSTAKAGLDKSVQTKRLYFCHYKGL